MEDETSIGIDWSHQTPVTAVSVKTLRDQFAMSALTGLCAHPDREGTYQYVAEQAYLLADQMLAARGGK